MISDYERADIVICSSIPKLPKYIQVILCKVALVLHTAQLLHRAGKKLKTSARGHFEGSELSSKVRYFRPKKIATKVRDLRPILNPHAQYFLNPQSLILILIIILNTSLILNPQCSSSSSILNCLSSIPASKSRQKCGILGPSSRLPQSFILNPNLQS